MFQLISEVVIILIVVIALLNRLFTSLCTNCIRFHKLWFLSLSLPTIHSQSLTSRSLITRNEPTTLDLLLSPQFQRGKVSREQPTFPSHCTKLFRSWKFFVFEDPLPTFKFWTFLLLNFEYCICFRFNIRRFLPQKLSRNSKNLALGIIGSKYITKSHAVWAPVPLSSSYLIDKHPKEFNTQIEYPHCCFYFQQAQRFGAKSHSQLQVCHPNNNFEVQPNQPISSSKKLYLRPMIIVLTGKYINFILYQLSRTFFINEDLQN